MSQIARAARSIDMKASSHCFGAPLLAGTLLLLVAGCDWGTSPGDPPSISGSYALTAVDGEPLPYRMKADSTGTTTTVLGGALTLGRAKPEKYVLVPSGAVMSASCIYSIPDSAWVDINNVVHLPDSTTYALPPCGDGPFTLTLTRRDEHPDGTSEIRTDTLSALYTWGYESSKLSGDQGDVTLVGSLSGTFSVGTSATTLALYPPYAPWEGVPRDLPTYDFTRTGS